MLVIDDLDGATVECAGALVAREHAAARQVRPELPAGFDSAEVCAAALQRLCDTDGAPYPRRKIMTAPQSVSGKPKQLDAGRFQPELSSYRLHRGRGRQDGMHPHPYRSSALLRRRAASHPL
jgi:hypothetical protein